MKILFVYPPNVSLAIGYISAILKKGGHSTDLILDPMLFADDEFNIRFLARIFSFKKKILKKIENYKPDFVAFSVATDNYKWACELAELIKTKTDAKIVFGGIHPTSVPEKVIQNKFVDYVIVGEGEFAMLDLINNPSRKDISNVWCKNKIIKNEIRPLISNLDLLPYPDMDIFYSNAPYLKEVYYITTSRGCPNGCSYCCNNFLRRLYSKGYVRKRSVNNVIKELEMAKQKYKPKLISFRDDNFVSDKERFKELMHEYKNRIGLPFKCISIPYYLDEEKIEILADSGCIRIELGVQTANEKNRKEICYRLESNDKIREVVKLLKKKHIHTYLDHIFGLPTEDLNSHIEAVRFYNSLRPTQINKFWLKYYPKTEIINIALKKGILTEEDVKKIDNAEFGQSCLKGGSVKDYKKLMKIQTLLSILPLMPSSLVNFILDKKLYRFFPSGYFTVLVPKIIKMVFFKELRFGLRYIIMKYGYYLR